MTIPSAAVRREDERLFLFKGLISDVTRWLETSNSSVWLRSFDDFSLALPENR